MIDADFLKILCCPESRQPLALAEGTLVTKLNADIAADSLKNRAGKPVTRSCDGALLRKDGQFAYLICSGIPILLPDEAIPVSAN
jgi:uncharacterized protein YbaR (Trm112 family)